MSNSEYRVCNSSRKPQCENENWQKLSNVLRTACNCQKSKCQTTVTRIQTSSAIADRSHVNIRGRPCKNFALHQIWSQAKFVRCFSYYVHACRRSQCKWFSKKTCLHNSAPSGLGVADARNTHSPTCVIVPNLVILGQTVLEICRKIWTPHAPPFKVTGTDTDWSATYDFPLLFHSNCSPSSYRFRDKWWYLQNFPLLVLNAPTEVLPLRIL